MTSFSEILAMERLDWSADGVRFRIKIAENHKNRHDHLHGGAIMSFLDTAGLWAGNWSADGPVPAATLSMTCNFVDRAEHDTLIAKARLNRKTRSVYFADAELSEEATGKVIATGQGVFKYVGR